MKIGNISTHKIIPKKLIQTMASLVLRYSDTIPQLKPSAFALFRLIKKQSKSHDIIHLTKEIIGYITLWRYILIKAFIHPEILCAPYSCIIYNDKNYHNYANAHLDFQMWSDAATNPMCIGIFSKYCWLQFYWPRKELIPIATLGLLAAVMAYLFVCYLQPNSKHIHIFIDNQNTNSWMNGLILILHII